MRTLIAAPLVALSFLSALPVPAVHADVRAFPRALAWFPLVGALLGILAAALDAFLLLALPATVAAALVVTFLALITGGLHLDGLADAADGLFGGRDPGERLALMRDGRVGAFGAAALVLVVGVEIAALASLPAPARGAAIVAACALARWSMAVAIWRYPYARASGAGSAFKAGVRGTDALAATVIALAVTVVATGAGAAALVALAAAVTVAAAAYAGARLGGLTGDAYGAIGEIVFAASLVAATALAS